METLQLQKSMKRVTIAQRLPDEVITNKSQGQRLTDQYSKGV